jgi:hypothetical protein
MPVDKKITDRIQTIANHLDPKDEALEKSEWKVNPFSQ